MRALITGVSGFVGGHLANHLATRGAEVFGADRLSQSPVNANLAAPLFVGDLLDESFVRAALADIKPTHIFHLAGILSGAPGGYEAQYRVNVLGTAAIFETLRSLGLSPWVLVASSSGVYGAPQQQPIDESCCWQPLTHYAASKAAQEMAALQAHLAYGIPLVRTRTFNMIGTGQALSLLTSDLAQQVVAAEAGGQPVMRVGNVTARRDFSDVRDVVRAYALLADKSGAGGVFNVCSGSSHSVQECIDVFMQLARVPLQLEVESSRIRTTEIDEQVGDPRKLFRATGWQPEISFSDSLKDLLEHHRQRHRNGEN